MLVIIREGTEPSPKVEKLLQSLELSSDRILFVGKSGKKFLASQSGNSIILRASARSIFTYFLLMAIKSPNDIRDGIIRRLLRRNVDRALINSGFFSTISDVLYNFFGTSSVSTYLMSYLTKVKDPKLFVIDEFISLKTLNLKKLKKMGPIIYVSQDIAYTRYGFADNIVSQKLMYTLESEIATLADLIICCSERDRLKYLEMGAERVVVFPNIYPIAFDHTAKYEVPSITLVLKARWGPIAKKALDEVMAALSLVELKNIKLNIIGMKPEKLPKNVDIQYWSKIPSEEDFLKVLSKSWIGINVGIHKGGTNERKYQYALSGLIVFSDHFGLRGDVIPYEYSYLDKHDLAAKLKQILDLGQEKVVWMGNENHNHTLLLVEKYQKIVKQELARFNVYF